MPKELITTTIVTDDHVYTRSLHVAWGAKGGAPEAPDGWVNAGFAQVQIREDHAEHGDLTGISLDPEQLDHLIRVLKRVKRQAFREGRPALSSDEERFVDEDGRPLRIWDGHSQ